MATKARLHWFWRGMIAVIPALAVHAICATYTVPKTFWGDVFDRLQRLLRPWVGEEWAVGLPATLLFAVPAMAVAFGIYAFSAWNFTDPEASGELHCRRCDYILRGLSEPRCPECGEAI